MQFIIRFITLCMLIISNWEQFQTWRGHLCCILGKGRQCWFMEQRALIQHCRSRLSPRSSSIRHAEPSVALRRWLSESGYRWETLTQMCLISASCPIVKIILLPSLEILWMYCKKLAAHYICIPEILSKSIREEQKCNCIKTKYFKSTKYSTGVKCKFCCWM